MENNQSNIALLQLRILKKKAPPPNQNFKKQNKKTKDKSMTKAEKASKSPKKPTLHPIIPNKEETADDSLAFYTVSADDSLAF